MQNENTIQGDLSLGVLNALYHRETWNAIVGILTFLHEIIVFTQGVVLGVNSVALRNMSNSIGDIIEDFQKIISSRFDTFAVNVKHKKTSIKKQPGKCMLCFFLVALICLLFIYG